MPEPALQAYFDEVFEVFRDADAYELFPETRTVLEQLRLQGYRLGILSNFDSRLHDVLGGLGIGSFFDTVVLSWDAGFAKPDARIFQHALRTNGIPAVFALHVGDSLSEDFEGAAAAGMRGLLLDRKNAWPVLTSVPRVASLLEIPGMMRFSRG
jgi:putative hydrolase of the HAD superfamily